MTNVEKIGFNFCAMDEAFVRNLYVGWDSFYRDAFDAVVDEFLSRHNEEGRLLRLDRLDLNLGSISQDDFYLQFPVRLREELERVFLFRSAQVGVRESLVDQIKRRLACLKFYLEKGFCPTEWESAEFEFEKEVRFLLPYASAAMARLFHESIGQSSQLYRLKWNLSTEQFGHLMLFWLEDKSISRKEKEQRYAQLRKVDSSLEPSLYKMLNSIPLLSEKLSALLSEEHRENSMSWLLSTTVSAYEKRRLLSGLLEWEPTVVIRYIHETQDEKGIHSLAILLDKIMVRKIIYAECEDHTEADVPAYWIYLYNWLLKYYPFNGIYMFGNKLQFQEYLNMKLLQFIRKRSYSAFLSREDITIQFLMEVFGQEYYIEVLNVIYNQQAHNADGSPVYTDYLNMELYFMFLHLSLIKMPVQRDKGAESSASFVDGGGEEAYAYDVQALNKWLADKRIGTKEKRMFLTLLVKERPSVLIKVLEVQPENQALLAELMDQSLIYELLSSVSFYATELFIKLVDYLHSSSNGISWLSGVATEYLSLFIRIAMLRWIGAYKNRATDSQESVSLFLRILHQEVSSSTYGNKSSVRSKEKEIKETIHLVSGQLSLSDDGGAEEDTPDVGVFSGERESMLAPEWALKLSSLLRNRAVSTAEKQRVLARLLEHFRSRCDEFISVMKEQSLLRSCILLMDQVLFEQLIRLLTRKGSESQSVCLLPFYRWIFTNEKAFQTFFSGEVAVMKERMTILLAHWATHGSVKDKKTPEIALLFLTGLFGADNVVRIVSVIHQELVGGMSGVESSDGVDALNRVHKSDELLELLLRMSDASKMDVTDSEWNEEGLEGWLKNPDISVDAKRSVIRKYIIWRPDRILVFIRRLIHTQVILVDEWAEWLDEDDWIHMIAGISLSKAELLEQVIVYLRQKQLVTEDSIRKGIIRYLAEKEQGSWLRETVSETARRFILIVCLPDGGNETEASLQDLQLGFGKDEIVPMVIAELLIKDMEDNMEEKRSMNEPEYVNVDNAGLALLAPWFPRLFAMLGMLNGEKKDFKDMESRIRAIFILQRLVTYEDREYKESELAFNRILVGCPFYEPLPAKMELTEEELDIIESMMNGIKGNWPKVQNISIRGFQHNFIERSGHLEQKDDKWLLSVDTRAYDVLMDSVPWSYNRVQFPWLTLPIHVSWRSKQEF